MGTDEFNGGGFCCSNGLASHSGGSREMLGCLKRRITNSVYEMYCNFLLLVMLI